MSRLLAWVTSILLLLLVLEGLTRLFTSAPATEPDPRMGWVYKENVHLTRTTDGENWDFKTNGARLRAPEGHGLGAKKPGERRVLLLGDSFTVGWGLESDATFAAQLEKLCAESGRAVTVIPAGTEAYYTDQECLWLESHLSEYQPDAVVVCPYANDVVGNALPKYLATNKPLFPIGAEGKISGPPAPVADGRPFWLRWSRLASTINTIRLGFTSMVEVPPQCGGGRLQLDDFPFLRNEPDVLKQGWRATDAIAARIVEKAKEKGVAQVFAAPIPNRFEIHAEDVLAFERMARCAPGSLDFTAVTRKLGEAFSKGGATVIDAKPAIAAAAATGARLYFRTDWHFNEDGARLYGRQLFEGLEKAGVLGSAGSAIAGPTPLTGEHHRSGSGVPTWVFVVGGIWVALSLGFRLAYPDENPAFAFVKVGVLLAFVVGVFVGIHFLMTAVSPGVKFLIFAAILIAIATYAIYKTRSRFGTIRELFGALVDRGHWYLVPMLVVMLTISILLVVAQNPIVAPFIYTLF